MSRFGLVLLFALFLLFSGGCAGETVRTYGKSMEPAIRSGEFVELDAEAYARRGPRTGDIVSSKVPVGAEDDQCGVPFSIEQPCPAPTDGTSGTFAVIKRVAAVGGQEIAFDARGHAIVDGRPAPDFPVIACKPDDDCRLPEAVEVPMGFFFLVGDNLPYSSDSRLWGPVPLAMIEGKVTPPKR